MKNYEEKFYLENFVPFFSLINFCTKKQREEEETIMGHSYEYYTCTTCLCFF